MDDILRHNPSYELKISSVHNQYEIYLWCYTIIVSIRIMYKCLCDFRDFNLIYYINILYFHQIRYFIEGHMGPSLVKTYFGYDLSIVCSNVYTMLSYSCTKLISRERVVSTLKFKG